MRRTLILAMSAMWPLTCENVFFIITAVNLSFNIYYKVHTRNDHIQKSPLIYVINR